MPSAPAHGTASSSCHTLTARERQQLEVVLGWRRRFRGAPELLSAQCGNAAPVTEVPAAAGEKTAARKTLPLGPTLAGDSMIRGES